MRFFSMDSNSAGYALCLLPSQTILQKGEMPESKVNRICIRARKYQLIYLSGYCFLGIPLIHHYYWCYPSIEQNYRMLNASP
mmetsp:Transcript_30217/g.64797  ORF Transcript_30217/g.64797 Transcript_30217/m.64797 type:complete len:82 (-) Transcript_30217:25-270(-)